MEPQYFVLLVLTGLAAGFINVMAAGGSLISMPILIFLGLEPAMANGTNRVAILVQNITAVSIFRGKGMTDLRLSLSLSLCTVPGAIAGALAAVAVDPDLFKRILGAVLIVAVILISRRAGPSSPEGLERKWPVLAHVGMVGAGFYGGFLQAGVGFVIMPILFRLLQMNLVQVNMHKVFIVGVYTVPALLVFAAGDKVWWLGGLALATGNAVGARLAAHVTISHGEGAIKVVFILAVIAMGAKLLFG